MYEMEIISDVPADNVREVIGQIRASDRYVMHHTEPEEDGQFTILVIFRALAVND